MTDKPAARLARYVEARRKELRLDQTDLKARGGPSHATVGAIERQEVTVERLQRGTKTGLERALNWMTGSVDNVIAGGEPVPATLELLGSFAAGNVTVGGNGGDAPPGAGSLHSWRHRLARPSDSTDPHELKQELADADMHAARLSAAIVAAREVVDETQRRIIELEYEKRYVDQVKRALEERIAELEHDEPAAQHPDNVPPGLFREVLDAVRTAMPDADSATVDRVAREIAARTGQVDPTPDET